MPISRHKYYVTQFLLMLHTITGIQFKKKKKYETQTRKKKPLSRDKANKRTRFKSDPNIGNTREGNFKYLSLIKLINNKL